jgi:hypothetical protein
MSIVQGQVDQWTYAITDDMTFLHPEVGVHRFQHCTLATTLAEIGAEPLPALCALICRGFERAPLDATFVQNILWLAWAVRTQMLRRAAEHIVAHPPVWGVRGVPLVGTLPQLLQQTERGLLRRSFALADYLPAPFVKHWTEHPVPITETLALMHDYMTVLLQGRTEVMEPLLALLLP